MPEMPLWKRVVTHAWNTGIAIYTGFNDFYQPLREILHPLYAFLRLFTTHYKSPFAKQQHKSAIILIWLKIPNMISWFQILWFQARVHIIKIPNNSLCSTTTDSTYSCTKYDYILDKFSMLFPKAVDRTETWDLY